MKNTIKSITIVAALAMALLLPLGANAQYYEGSLLRDDPSNNWQREGLMNNRSITLWTANNGITNQGVGEPAPLGSGLLVLTAAGLGYAALRRKRSSKD